MRDHQRYFSVEGDDKRLLPYFITLSNMEVPDPGERFHYRAYVAANTGGGEMIWLMFLAESQDHLRKRMADLQAFVENWRPDKR